MDYYFRQLVDTGTALGKGIYSVGEDIVLGLERSGEGLGMSGYNRISQIGYEDGMIVSLIKETSELGYKERSPLYKAIKIILTEYYSKIPEEVLKTIAEKSGILAAYMTGRMHIGKQLAAFIAKRIAFKIAASAVFKQLATKISVSSAASASWIGTPIGLLMGQGVLQRSSYGSHRLQKEFPKVHLSLRKANGLDFVYFLIEEPLKKHLKAIKMANSIGTIKFQGKTLKIYDKKI